MPNIEDFSAGNIAIRPTETGVEAAAAAGRRLGAYGSQIASAYQQAAGATGRAIKEAGDTAVSFIDHQQINAGADHSSAMWANLEDNWNRTASSADPHDPSTAAKWRNEVLEPTLTQFSDGFTTEKSQEWANRTVNTMRQHFFTQTEGEMSAIAKVAVTATAKSMRDNLSVAAMQNPGGVSAMLGQVDDNLSTIVDRHPNLKGAEAASVRIALGDDIKRQIVHAGAVGAMSSSADPEASLASYLKNKDVDPYVNATEEAQFAKTARYYSRVAESEAKHEQAQVAADNKVKAGDAEKQLQLSLIPDGNTPPPSPAELHDGLRKFGLLPGVTGPQLQRMTNNVDRYIKKLGQPDVQTQKDNYDKLAARLTDPDNPLTMHDIVQNIDNLSKADAAKLKWSVNALATEELRDPLLKNALSGAREIVQGASGAERIMNAGKYATFVNNFLPEYLRDKRAGTLPADALNLANPDSMISKAMAPYRGGLADVIRANGGVGAAPPLPTYTAPATAAAVTTAKEAVISTKAEYDKLPPGTPFTHNGKKFIKPAAGAILGPGEM